MPAAKGSARTPLGLKYLIINFPLMGTTGGVIKDCFSSFSTIVNTQNIIRYLYSSFGGGNNCLKLHVLKYFSKDRKLLIKIIPKHIMTF